jgi:predicted NBD/HSP70 family sugar kinase
MKVLCFDIGGTAIKYGVIEDEKLITSFEMATEYKEGSQAVLNKLAKVTTEMITAYGVKGVGISVAGSVDYDRGVIVNSPESIPEFQDLDFKRFFKENFNLDAVADNDVNCFGIAEGRSGAGKNIANFLTMTIGTGIGGAIIFNHKLWRGFSWNGGEFGRMLLGKDKYETVASVTALIGYANEYGLNVNSGYQVFELYDHKDPKARKAVIKFYENVARGIANLIYIFDPEKIIIGGGITNRGALLDELNKALKEVINPRFYKDNFLAIAEYKNAGGMFGAYYNFIDFRRLEDKSWKI